MLFDDPPAIVARAETPKAKLAALVSEYLRNGRREYAAALEIGQELALHKAHLDKGDWQAWLKENFTLSAASARRFLRIFNNRSSAIGASTEGEALDMIARAEKMKNRPQSGGPEPEAAYCDRCERVGVVKGCEACAKLKAAGAKGKKKRKRLETIVLPNGAPAGLAKDVARWRLSCRQLGEAVDKAQAYLNKFAGTPMADDLIKLCAAAGLKITRGTDGDAEVLGCPQLAALKKIITDITPDPR